MSDILSALFLLADLEQSSEVCLKLWFLISYE